MLKPLALLLLLGAASAAAPAPAPVPPLCRVTAQATPSWVRGTYTVTVSTTTTLSGEPCPEDGYALIRLESGRLFPWRLIQPGEATTYYGVPFYWRGGWQAASGRVYTFRIVGLRAPFDRDRP